MRTASSVPAGYLQLKAAQQLFGKPPEALDAQQRARIERVCAHQLLIEQRILATPEAARVTLDCASTRQAVDAIRARYADEDEFIAALTASGCDLAQLSLAIERELRVEAVLERVADDATETGASGEVSDVDVEIFYLMHRERFVRPETRTLRHVLVTINDALPGNERAAARARIDAIHARLARSPQRFGEQAHKHSECPTAMNGGQLGTVRRGELFNELDAVAFALAPGEISAVVESPLGFHVLQCVDVHAGGEQPLAAVSERIRARIASSRRKSAQKQWIAGLFRAAEKD